MSDRDIRQLSCSGHQVVHQCACQQLPPLVVSYLFEKPSSDSGDNSSHHLALNDRGIQDGSAIMDGGICQDTNVSRARIDRDDNLVSGCGNG